MRWFAVSNPRGPGYQLTRVPIAPVGPVIDCLDEATEFAASLRDQEPTQEALDTWRSARRIARDARADFAEDHGLEVCEDHGAPLYFRPDECRWSEGNCPWCWSRELDEMASYGHAEASKELTAKRKETEAKAARVPNLEYDLRAEKEQAANREQALRDKIHALQNRLEEAERAAGWRR